MRLTQGAAVRVVDREHRKRLPKAWRSCIWTVEKVFDMGDGFGVHVSLVAGERRIVVARASVELAARSPS